MNSVGIDVYPDDAFSRPRVVAECPGFLRHIDGPTAAVERVLPERGRLLWCGMPPLATSILRQWLEAAAVH